MADDVKSKVTVEAETGQAKNEIKSLSGAFGGFFTDLKSSAGLGASSFNSFFGGLSKAGGQARAAFGALNTDTLTLSQRFKLFGSGIVDSFRTAGGSAGRLGTDLKGVAELGKGVFADLGTKIGMLGPAFAGMGKAAMVAGGTAVGAFLAVAAPIAAVGLAVWKITTSFADAGDSIYTMSKQTQLSAATLSAFQYVAGQTNTTVDTIANNVFKMSINIEKGGKTTEAAFRGIGLSSKELRDLKPEEQFTKIMTGLQGIPDAGQRALIGTTIFGKGFRSISQLVDEDLAGLMKNAKTFGLVMSDEMAAAGDKFGDTMTDVSSIFQGLRNILGAAVLPIVNVFIGTVRDELIVVLTLLKNVFGPLFAGFTGFSKGLQASGESADFHAKVFKFLITVIAGFIDAIARVIDAVKFAINVWYEFRIAGNLLLQAFGKIVEGILWATLKLTEGLAKVSPGALGERFARDAEELRGTLTKVRADIAGLGTDTARLDAEKKKINDTLTTFSGKLKTGADQLRDQAAAYKGTKSAADPLRPTIAGLGTDFDEMGNAAGESKDKVSQFAKTASKDIAELAKEWRAQPAAIRENKESIGVLLAKYEELRAKVTDPSKLPADLEKLRAEHQRAIPIIAERTRQNVMLLASVKELPKALTAVQLASQGLDTQGRLLNNAQAVWIAQAPKVTSALMAEREAAEKAAEKTREFKEAWAQTLDTMAEAFETLANIAGDSGLGKVAQFMGNVIGTMNLGTKSATTFGTGLDTLQKGGMANVATGAMGMASGIMGGIGAMQQATNHASTAKNIFGGMATGMAMGAQIAGPWGAAVGAAVGAIWGAFKGKPDWAKIQEEIKKDFAFNVSEALAKEIEKTSKEVKSKSTAILLHLSDILKEAGGITTANVEQWTKKTGDLFTAVQKGSITAQQATKQLEEVFPQLAAAIDKTTGLASKSFVELVKMNNQFGVSSAAITQFVQGELTKAVNGVATFLKNATISNQEAATALGNTVAVVFKKIIADGGNVQTALQALNPVINDLEKQLKETGFEGGEAFAEIRDLAALASKEIVSKAITAVSGLDAVMKAMHNTGLMDQAMFSGLAGQIGSTWQKLIDQGEDGTQVMRLMQPQIQTVWELVKKHGFAVDETTAKMLAEAEASGVVGSQYQSATDRMVSATERMSTVLDAMARKMGVDVPNAANAMAGSGVGASDQVANKFQNSLVPAIENARSRIADPGGWYTFRQNADSSVDYAINRLGRIPRSITTTHIIEERGGGGGGGDDGGGGGGGGGGSSSEEERVRADWLSRNPGDEARWGEVRGGYGFAIGAFVRRPVMARIHGNEVVSPLSTLSSWIQEAARIGATAGGNIASNTHTGTVLVVNVDARGSVFETERTVQALTDKIGTKLADKYFGGVKVKVTSSGQGR